MTEPTSSPTSSPTGAPTFSPTKAPTDVDEFYEYQTLGAGLTVIGVAITVFGLNGMKYYQTKSGLPQPWKMPRAMLAKWLGTLFLWGFGQVVMLSAVNYATSDVCAATANIALVVNAFVANWLFGESFNVFPICTGNILTWLLHWDLGAILYNIGGAVLVVFSAPELKDSKLPKDLKGVKNQISGNALFLWTMIATVVLMVLKTLFVTAKRGKKSTLQGLAYGFFAGACGGVCYTLTKVGFLLTNDDKAWHSWVFYTLWMSAGVFELLNVVATNIGMYYQEAMVVVPAYYVSMSIFSTLQELALFKLYDEFTPQSTAKYVTGLALCIIGVGIIAYRPDSAIESESVDKEELLQTGLLRECSESGAELALYLENELGPDGLPLTPHSE
jgi:hypothetical protein